MKPYMLLAALAVIMIALSRVADAQTATPTANPPGITQGPWTSAKPGNSKSQCSPGEYAVGIEVEGAPPGAKPVSGAFQGSESSAYVTVSNLFGGVLLDSGRRYLAMIRRQ
jgi:hypothetical protein